MNPFTKNMLTIKIQSCGPETCTMAKAFGKKTKNKKQLKDKYTNEQYMTFIFSFSKCLPFLMFGLQL